MDGQSSEANRITELRKRSRQDYLERREKSKLELLRLEIEDDLMLWNQGKLSRREKNELDRKKKVYEIAVEREAIQREHALSYSAQRKIIKTAHDGKLVANRYVLPDSVVEDDYVEQDSERVNDALMQSHQDLENDELWWSKQLSYIKSGKDSSAGPATAPTGYGGYQSFEIEIEVPLNSTIHSELDAGQESPRTDVKSSNKRKCSKTAFESGDHLEPLNDSLIPQQDTKRSSSKHGARSSSIQEQRRLLPIYAYREKLLNAIDKNDVIILVGETGSGKSTQLAQYLIESGRFLKVAVTQPRRVAAMSLATRVAEEMGAKLGQKVGYAVRFEYLFQEDTQIKFLTDGVLLREVLNEPDLAQYDAVVIDEAHERSLATDLLLALLKDMVRYRSAAAAAAEESKDSLNSSRGTTETRPLKLIVASATMNAASFGEYFDNAPIIEVPGRRFSVDILYTKTPQPDYVASAVRTVLHIHASLPRGDILLFLSGQNEIEAAAAELRAASTAAGSLLDELIVAPVYAALPPEQQAAIFQPTPENARKVVVATNIAETSLTIDGVVYVVDSGLAKVKLFHPKSKTESLQVMAASQAAAIQRAGRAGRTQPGVCFRLFTKWSYEHEMPQQTLPEISRSDLSSMVLTLKSLGLEDLVHFDFVLPPPTDALVAALELLYAVKALDAQGELTSHGRTLAELPIEVTLGTALINSDSFGCLLEMSKLAAMISVCSSGGGGSGSVFYTPRGEDSDATTVANTGDDEENPKNKVSKLALAQSAKRLLQSGGSLGFGGDPISLLNVYLQWEASGHSAQWCFDHFVQYRTLNRARDIFEQLHALVTNKLLFSSSSRPSSQIVREALCSGYFVNACKLQRNGEYKTLMGSKIVHIHPSSSLYKSELRPKWIAYTELLYTTKLFIRGVFEVEAKWISRVAPHVFSKKELMEQRITAHLPPRQQR